ncbi:MAG: dihydroxy-acid dehydratase, partial [Deltaproteobacteria bacterium]|nr:dihydroxy-acid dehydratase [Deltaproteobacteria bacterium]
NVTAGTLGEMLDAMNAGIQNPDVIRPIEQPVHQTGGLAVLKGNLAPDGAIVKQAAVAEEMLVHSGTARVFDSEDDAFKAIMAKQIKKGDVVVIRYEGPKGGPGMREMLSPTSTLAGMGMDREVALITDGRFSGASKGASIGHISPEAAAGGPVAIVKDGDMIDIDIPEKTIHLRISDEEIRSRLNALPAFEPRVKSGYLARYASLVSSADKGAVFPK